jgi:hypothetical protein
MEEFSSEFFKRARKMGRESITGRLAKSMKVNSKMTSAKVRVHFTTQMVKISWGYGKRVRSTERGTTNGPTVQNTTLFTTKVSRDRSWES